MSRPLPGPWTLVFALLVGTAIVVMKFFLTPLTRGRPDAW